MVTSSDVCRLRDRVRPDCVPRPAGRVFAGSLMRGLRAKTWGEASVEIATEERGCVADQPQHVESCSSCRINFDPSYAIRALRLVFDTAALLSPLPPAF